MVGLDFVINVKFFDDLVVASRHETSAFPNGDPIPIYHAFPHFVHYKIFDYGPIHNLDTFLPLLLKHRLNYEVFLLIYLLKKMDLQWTPWSNLETQIFGEIVGFVVTLDGRR